jgi:glycosyltransferase involved in cell wall biosynthesis
MIARPRIAIDGVFFQIANSGIARVWHSLFQEWVKSGFCQHLLIIDRAGTAPQISGLTYARTPLFDYQNPTLESIYIQAICDQEQIDLFISTYHTIPLSTPSIVLVHDMLPEIFNTDLSVMPLQEKYWSVLHACHYISVSTNTAGDLQKFFPDISKDRITIALNGISSEFCPQNLDQIQSFKIKYQIEKPFFLIVGNRYANGGFKNVVHFFRAFAKLPDCHQFEIVCIGGYHILEPELAQLVGNTKVSVLSLVDIDLMAAYSGAIALIYPSLYEGFGLPILEAMACACPVITCANSSIPEVAGNAAVYVSATDTDQLTMALIKVQNLEVRSQLISAGLAQSKYFSWTKMADTIAKVIIDTHTSIQVGKLLLSPKLLLWTRLRKIQSQQQQLLIATTTNLAATATQLAIINADLSTADAQIISMKNTKFWKLRQQWFRFKKMLRLIKQDSP